MEVRANVHRTLNTPDVRLPLLDHSVVCESALEYVRRGWSVIPLAAREKRPALPSWREFQSRLPTSRQIDRWFHRTQANIGIVTGELSGLVVVDCDTPDDMHFWQEQFPQSPVAVVTGRGGGHIFYRYRSGETIGNRAGLLGKQIDLRAQGGYVVAPPSIHPNGSRYQWAAGPDFALSDVPYFSSSWIDFDQAASKSANRARQIRRPANYIRSIRAIAGEGGHNQTYRAACVLRDAGLSPEETLCELIIWNEANAEPPWTAKELL